MYRRRILPLVLAAAPLTGCVIGQRLGTLEAQTAALALQSERLDSTAEAIEKNRDRLDAVVPGDAQWMELELGGILRWYLGEAQGNAYVQFRALGPAVGEARVLFSTSIKEGEVTLRPGVSVAHRLKGDAGGLITLTLHRVRYTEGAPTEGLFSVTLSE